jgi:hypothetical protein
MGAEYFVSCKTCVYSGEALFKAEYASKTREFGRKWKGETPKITYKCLGEVSSYPTASSQTSHEWNWLDGFW